MHLPNIVILMEIILKGKDKPTRILRPCEARMLIDAIPKNENKDKFEALLYTGARYSELKWLYDNPKMFADKTIKIFSTKGKAVHTERYIRLNTSGQRAVNYFLRAKRNLPHYTVWDENLKRWARMANLDPTGISIKTTRKTYESWLVTGYPKKLDFIYLSQGHTKMTALDFYLMLPFTEIDMEEMKFYTDGWI